MTKITMSAGPVARTAEQLTRFERRYRSSAQTRFASSNPPVSQAAARDRWRKTRHSGRSASVLKSKPLLGWEVKGGISGREGVVDTMELVFEIVFFALAIPAFIADVLAGVSDRARRIGRINTGLLMLLGGAAVNAISLAVGVDYTDFADDAKFSWVTDAWWAVVPAHDVLLIGLLVAFEATVGVMILFGGRLAQVGLVGAIAFHVCLALFFSWFFTVYGLAMLLPLVMLLRAERCAAAARAHPPTAARGADGQVGASRRA